MVLERALAAIVLLGFEPPVLATTKTEPAVVPDPPTDDGQSPDADSTDDPATQTKTQVEPPSERARVHFEREQWDAAAEAFAEAFAEDPKPRFLYARAQALRFGGRCDEAIEVYEAYVDLEPELQRKRYARANIERCRAELPAPDPVDEPTPAPRIATPPPAVVDRPAARPQRDPVGIALVGTGSVAMVAGVALSAIGGITYATAPDQAPEDAFADALRNARIELGIGAPLVGVGIVLVAVGGARLALSRRRASAPHTARRAQWWPGRIAF